MKGEKQIIMKNGRNAISGTCSDCGTKMFKIVAETEKSKQRRSPKRQSQKRARKPRDKAQAMIPALD